MFGPIIWINSGTQGTEDGITYDDFTIRLMDTRWWKSYEAACG